MSTLAELQARMAGADQADAIAAGNELANYFVIYNDEFNTLIVKRHDAETALFDVSHDPAGVDHAEVFRLQSLILNTESRMKFQDGTMIAFQASALSIAAPDPALVNRVRVLSAQVSVIAAKGAAIESIVTGLAEIAALVNQVQGT